MQGFGLIEILAVLVIILILFSLKSNVFSKAFKHSSLNVENRREQLATKENVENQVRDIQQIAKERYY